LTHFLVKPVPTHLHGAGAGGGGAFCAEGFGIFAVDVDGGDDVGLGGGG
jgi:hypothetical protein